MSAVPGVSSCGVEEEEKTRRVGANPDERAVHRIMAIANHLAPDIPSPADTPLTKKAAPIDVEALTAQNERLNGYVDQLATDKATLEDYHPANTAAPSPIFPFPNLAWEAVKAGLAKEELTNKQLKAHIAEAEKHQKDIDLLLDLSAELTSYKEDTEMPEKMRSLLKELKERGIDLWKSEETVLSKEKIAELKSLSSGQVDKLRSNLQIIFTTKIQSLIQSIGAIMETLKEIIRNNTKLINTANRKDH